MSDLIARLRAAAEIKEIELTTGGFTKVDEDHCERLSKYKWHKNKYEILEKIMPREQTRP